MRVGIFIDGITLFHGLDGRRLHFGVFKDWLSGDNETTVASYFNSVDNVETKRNFFSHVFKSGFKTYIRKSKYDHIEDTYDIQDFNIELTTEVMFNIDECDKIILVSGKHDFLPLCERLASKGKVIEIVGFKNSINKVFNKYNIRYIDDFLSIKK